MARTRRYMAIGSAALLGIALVALGPILTRFDYTAIGTRDSWQLPERVVQEVALKPGDTVADIGAGDGYFTFRLAKAVTDSGQVFAVEIDAGILSGLRSTAERNGATNIKTVLATPNDPQLPDASVDVAFFCNVYHHIEAREDYFRALRQDLAPGGRVAIIEMTDSVPLRWLGHSGHWTSVETLRQEMQKFGYRLVSRHEFLPLQNFLVFESAEES